MKQIIIYEKEYKFVVNKSYRPKSHYETEPQLIGRTVEDNEKDCIRDFLSESSIEIEYEELKEMRIGIPWEVYKPVEFLWFEDSLFHIKLSEKDGKKKGNYKRIVKIQSMPPSKIPKTLEQFLIKENFKKIK